MNDVLSCMAAWIPWMQGRADALDREAAFPVEEFARLRRLGALAPRLPVRGDASVDDLATLLTLAGQGNLSVGRLLEAHVNAMHLIARYGSSAPWHEDTLFGLWVTDPPERGLRMRRDGSRIMLSGGKQFCSGAGHVAAALVTAQDADGNTRMLVLRLGIGERVTPLPAPLSGMRAATTGSVDFTDCETTGDAVLGRVGDYLAEPDFSAGAWRGSAVALGGLIALLDHAIEQLRTSGRLRGALCQERIGRAIIARETSRMWVRAAAASAENPLADPASRIATVGLGRIAVETACLDAMRSVQRSVGLASFREGNPVERICRDLATYLRQPAPDDVLTEAAVWFADHPGAPA